jgi:hypothetical protein
MAKRDEVSSGCRVDGYSCLLAAWSGRGAPEDVEPDGQAKRSERGLPSRRVLVPARGLVRARRAPEDVEPDGQAKRSELGLAGSTGLEPAASGVTGRRSNQLNYDPKLCASGMCRLLVRLKPDTTFFALPPPTVLAGLSPKLATQVTALAD